MPCATRRVAAGINLVDPGRSTPAPNRPIPVHVTHMVIFRSPDGKPGYHQAETLEEAVAFVERLRNEDSVIDARVFRMDEVAIEFKVYYRVAVAGEGPPAAAEPAPAADSSAEPVATESTEAPAGASTGDEDAMAGNGAANAGRFGLFSRA
jgi:hypothetical protein